MPGRMRPWCRQQRQQQRDGAEEHGWCDGLERRAADASTGTRRAGRRRRCRTMNSHPRASSRQSCPATENQITATMPDKMAPSQLTFHSFRPKPRTSTTGMRPRYRKRVHHVPDAGDDRDDGQYGHRERSDDARAHTEAGCDAMSSSVCQVDSLMDVSEPAPATCDRADEPAGGAERSRGPGRLDHSGARGDAPVMQGGTCGPSADCHPARVGPAAVIWRRGRPQKPGSGLGRPSCRLRTTRRRGWHGRPIG